MSLYVHAPDNGVLVKRLVYHLDNYFLISCTPPPLRPLSVFFFFQAAAVAAMTADAEYRKRAAAALAAYSDGSLGSSYIPLPSSDSSDSDESAESNVSSDSPNSKNSTCDAPFKTHEDSYGSSNDSYHEKSRPDHGRKRKKEKDSDIYSDRKRHKKSKDEKKKKKKKTKKMKTKKKKSSNHGRNREHEPRDPTEKYRESQKKSMKES